MRNLRGLRSTQVARVAGRAFSVVMSERSGDERGERTKGKQDRPRSKTYGR